MPNILFANPLVRLVKLVRHQQINLVQFIPNLFWLRGSMPWLTLVVTLPSRPRPEPAEKPQGSSNRRTTLGV